MHLAGGQRPPLERLDLGRDLRGRDVLGLDHDLAPAADRPGTPRRSGCRVWTIGSPFGSPWRPGTDVCMLNAGIASATSSAAGEHRGDDRVLQHAVDDRAPDPRLGAALTALRDERNAALHDAVAELRQQRREHGQRAEHGDRDDEDRAGRHRGERLVAGEVHPGHRHDHGEAGDQHRAARGRGGGLERRLLVTAGAPAPRARGACRTASSRRRPPCRSAARPRRRPGRRPRSG